MQVKSDSDIPQSLFNSPHENINITARNKRPRAEFSPGNDLQDFKHELLEMLSSWKKEQEERLTNFHNDYKSSLCKLVSEISELKLQTLEIQKSNSEIEGTTAFISKQYDDMIKQIDDLQKEKLAFRNTILDLETKIQDLQLTTRSSKVEIRNVPIKENASVSDLSEIITKVGATVNMTINDTNLRDAYRLPGKPGSTRAIIAEFTTVQAKNLLLTSVRNFNKKHPNEDRLNTQCIGLSGERRPVFVAEYLSPSSRKLFHLAREFAKKNKFDFCWTANGNIFLRKKEGDKQILVKSEQTLRELQVSLLQEVTLPQQVSLPQQTSPAPPDALINVTASVN